jgi:ElaB/YqjD/DUF883 family membrane-anchored ribosome-binding protein
MEAHAREALRGATAERGAMGSDLTDDDVFPDDSDFDSVLDSVPSSPERSSLAGTAERIGNVVGTAHREVRRGLNLVRKTTERATKRPIAFPSAAAAAETMALANQLAHEGRMGGTREMREIGDEVDSLRRQAEDKLKDWTERANERFQELRRRTRDALARSRTRAQELVGAHPLETIAVIAGVCFALGVALRLRRPRHG